MAIKITSVRESVMLTKKREIIPTMVVEYTVDDQGPFTYEIPKEEFSREKARADIEAKAEEIRGLMME